MRSDIELIQRELGDIKKPLRKLKDFSNTYKSCFISNLIDVQVKFNSLSSLN